MSVRVRFAPSPTGALHIGGVRTALYNYLFAKKNKGTFLLRIEDTDQGRFVPGAEQYILDTLKWCGIEPTEGLGFGGPHAPYRQSERKNIYHTYANQLIQSGKAYYAFDTETDLEEMRAKMADEGVPAPKYDATARLSMKNSLSLSKEETDALLAQSTPYVIRLLVEPGEVISYHDIIREQVSFNTSELDDKVLIKADGMPTYHMANIIDDHIMEITHVIRGEEWISSTGHHLLLYKAFGWNPPAFAHLPLIMRPDGKGKLSKRDGARFGIPVFPLSWLGATDEESFMGFREFGFEPEAVLNFLAFLGWNPGTDQEIFSLSQMVEAFDLSKVHKSGARFDYQKAVWFNQQYVRSKSLATADIQDALNLTVDNNSQTIINPIINANTIKIFQERASFKSDIIHSIEDLCQWPKKTDGEALQKNWKPSLQDKLMEFTKTLSETASTTEASALEHQAKELLKQMGLKAGEVFPIYRLALAGSLQGPTVFQMLELLGPAGFERILSRLKEFSNLA